MMFIHFTWPFLSPVDRRQLNFVATAWGEYISLCRAAATTSLSPLQEPQLAPNPMLKPTQLPLQWSHLFSCALLRFHFIYGDMVRWLGGEYTNRHRHWSRVFRDILRRPSISAPASFPPPNYHGAYLVFTEGAPLCGRYVGDKTKLADRERYKNHPAIGKDLVQVEAKFAVEEAKSFHLILPQFLTSFLPGLFISPLQWEVWKGKGCICVDCTNSPTPVGAPNLSIPKPSADNADKCLPVYYSDAFQRHLVRLWRMHMARPEDNILHHCDDIDSVFQRILYHPDLALVFAYVLGPFVIVPVGMVFGARNAPSYFSLTSDVQANVATSCNLHSNWPQAILAAAADVAPLPADWSASHSLAPAKQDACHSPLTPLKQSTDGHSMFMDNNGVAAYRDDI
jgi:hypothetical protein